jgi:hypothetical protein
MPISRLGLQHRLEVLKRWRSIFSYALLGYAHDGAPATSLLFQVGWNQALDDHDVAPNSVEAAVFLVSADLAEAE